MSVHLNRLGTFILSWELVVYSNGQHKGVPWTDLGSLDKSVQGDFRICPASDEVLLLIRVRIFSSSIKNSAIRNPPELRSGGNYVTGFPLEILSQNSVQGEFELMLTIGLQA